MEMLMSILARMKLLFKSTGIRNIYRGKRPPNEVRGNQANQVNQVNQAYQVNQVNQVNHANHVKKVDLIFFKSMKYIK